MRREFVVPFESSAAYRRTRVSKYPFVHDPFFYADNTQRSSRKERTDLLKAGRYLKKIKWTLFMKRIKTCARARFQLNARH